ncbi:MAG: D-amino acid dehydrogenase [Proteobacteria bacterium]|nr:D-amino acid dehydrogenase [Pseudomonadota bacterium]
MKILVLGAGIAGVTAAHELSARGHDVTVVERHETSAMETSFANGGQLSYSHAEPWASPAVLGKIAKWIWKKDSPLLFRFNADPNMWVWGLKFLRNCTTKRALYNAENTLRLALYSRQVMHDIVREHPMEFSYRQAGIVHIFRKESGLNAGIKQAQWQQDRGCPFETLSAEEVVRRVPTLANLKGGLTGGLFFPYDESGDIHTFCRRLSEIDASKRQVKYLYHTPIDRVLMNGDKIEGVKTSKGILKADAYVMAAGSYSALLLKQVGIKIPVYPMKGYSISVPLKEGDPVPECSVTDQDQKLVYSKLGNVLRVAGTAEFAGYSHTITRHRVDSLKRQVKQLFAGCGDVERATEWACIRPSTPDGAPIIGQTKYSNLFLHTGHGTLGWTLAPGSARILADIVEGKTPEIDTEGLTLDKYR